MQWDKMLFFRTANSNKFTSISLHRQRVIQCLIFPLCILRIYHIQLQMGTSDILLHFRVTFHQNLHFKNYPCVFRICVE